MLLSHELGAITPDRLIYGGFPLSTDAIILATGSLKRGSVLGRILFAASAAFVGTGNGTLTDIVPGKDFKYGVYLATCLEAPLATVHEGVFRITDPDGQILGEVRLAAGAGGYARFSHPQISFTITDGTTNFVAADVFTVTVTSGVPTSSAVTGTGNGTLVQLEGRKEVVTGVYRVECDTAITNGGRFLVTAPDGTELGYAFASTRAGTGNGTFTQIKAGPAFKRNGAYTIACTAAATHGGTFSVTDPDGILIGTCTIPAGSGNSVRFTSDQISFLVTDGSTDFATNFVLTLHLFEHRQLSFVIWDGSTDFIVTDYFTITVTIAGRAVALVDRFANNGSQWPALVLAQDLDASVAPVQGAAYSTGKFNESALYFGGSDTIDDHRMAMHAIGLMTERSQSFD